MATLVSLTWAQALRWRLRRLLIDPPADKLSLLADARTWHTGSWQRAFVSLPVMAALAEVVEHALDGAPRTREELVAAIERERDDDSHAEPLRSGWSAAYGPATIEAFDAWLLRGATPKAKMRRWFAALGDELSHVEVENRPALVLSADIDELAATRPSSSAVHLLPAFDQYVLGPGAIERMTSLLASTDNPPAASP